jgi:pimeloyl-ACP methyl ester carboxylesterase
MLDRGAPVHDSRITLSDGRTLAFAEYGEPNGHPVMFFHGTPGGRLQHPQAIGAGAAGTRIISIERPGYGYSTHYTGWNMLNWADDVAALADALGIERFSVVGPSGGAPYAAACAYHLPERVRAAGLVSSPAPLPPDRPGSGQTGVGSDDLHEDDRAARMLSWPDFLAWFEQKHGGTPPDVEQMLASFAEWLPAWDKDVLALPEVQATFRLTLPEAFRQGLLGWAADSWIAGRPWGFRPEDIEVPTYVWHGELDQIVPVEHGQYLARTIPNCQAEFYPNTGHLIPPHRWDAILAALVGEAG